MTLAEAEATIKRLSHLVGYKIKESELTNFAIMPEKKDLVTEIANCLIDDKDYKSLLMQYNSFHIIVYYDLAQLLITGLLKWDYLQDVMKRTGMLGRMSDNGQTELR